MKIEQKKQADGKVLISAIASTAEVSRALNEAQIAFAQQMHLVPEKDKSISQVAEEHLGIKDLDAVVQDTAIENLVPFAIDKTGIIPSYPPSAERVCALKRGQIFRFNLEMNPKPLYELSSYEPVSFSVEPMGKDNGQLEEQIEAMAQRYTEYVADEPHILKKGDSCLLSMKSFQNDEPLQNLTADSRGYTTGIGLMPDDFDKQIIGMDVGETKTFSFQVPSLDEKDADLDTITCTVTVKEAQKKVVPQIDDAWVAKNMPMYADLAALRASIASQIDKQRYQQYEEYRRTLATDELAKRFEGSIADDVYEATTKNLIRNVRAQAQQQNMTFEQFVERQGGQQQFNIMLMMQARQMLVQGYALDALFRHEKLAVSDEDIKEACASLNPQNPAAARKHLEESGRGFALREAAERIKATKYLVQHANITTKEQEKPQ